jgi:hypothetical protein
MLMKSMIVDFMLASSNNNTEVTDWIYIKIIIYYLLNNQLTNSNFSLGKIKPTQTDIITAKLEQ